MWLSRYGPMDQASVTPDLPQGEAGAEGEAGRPGNSGPPGDEVRRGSMRQDGMGLASSTLGLVVTLNLSPRVNRENLVPPEKKERPVMR